MKKTFISIIVFISAFLLIDRVYAREVQVSDISNGSYVIGTHLFTRESNGDYNGTLTINYIMLAAGSIKSDNINDMTIYYKSSRGIWLNGVTGESVDEEFKQKNTIEINYKNNNTLFLDISPMIKIDVVSDSVRIYVLKDSIGDLTDYEYQLFVDDALISSGYNVVKGQNGENDYIEITSTELRGVYSLKVVSNSKSSIISNSVIYNEGLDLNIPELTISDDVFTQSDKAIQININANVDFGRANFIELFRSTIDQEELYKRELSSLDKSLVALVPDGSKYYYKARLCVTLPSGLECGAFSNVVNYENAAEEEPVLPALSKPIISKNVYKDQAKIRFTLENHLDYGDTLYAEVYYKTENSNVYQVIYDSSDDVGNIKGTDTTVITLNGISELVGSYKVKVYEIVDGVRIYSDFSEIMVYDNGKTLPVPTLSYTQHENDKTKFTLKVDDLGRGNGIKVYVSDTQKGDYKLEYTVWQDWVEVTLENKQLFYKVQVCDLMTETNECGSLSEPINLIHTDYLFVVNYDQGMNHMEGSLTVLKDDNLVELLEVYNENGELLSKVVNDGAVVSISRSDISNKNLIFAKLLTGEIVPVVIKIN